MSEDTDPSDDTGFFPQNSVPADEAFVIARALDRFGGGVLPRRVVVGPGDDAAVLDCGAHEFLVDSCDCLVEGVHFKKEWLRLPEFGASAVGARAVLCAASDIAAMGAVPKTVLVSAGLPSGTEAGLVEAFFDGVERGCKSVGAFVAGGNTASAPFIFIDVKITGETVGRGFVRNSGAKHGDALFVTGNLGGSDAALQILDGLLRKNAPAPDLSTRALLEKFRFPSPRIQTALALCEGKTASAMTDVSDGLLADMGRVISLSGAGAEIFLEKIPVSDGFTGGSRGAIVAGGDYEIVFTAPPATAEKIEEISQKTRVRITEIGRVTDSGTVKIFGPEGEVPASVFGSGGYVHNRKP